MESDKNICPQCHQLVLPQYYFCPNCGFKLNSAPLKTDIITQIGIYAFSIILPAICFIFVNRWQGTKYFKSNNPKAKQIGKIAWTLLVLSTIVVIWLVVIWTQNYIRETVNGINEDF